MQPSAVFFVTSAAPSVEEQAAWVWLRASSPAAEQLAPDDAWPAGSVVWWHTSAPVAAVPADALDWLREGGRLWLTLCACSALYDLGLEDRPPDELGIVPWQRASTELEALEGERRGLIGFGPHPIFDGLQRGVFLLRPSAGELYPQAVYTAPVRGRVAAAEWQYLAIDPNRRLAIEHEVGAGRVLAVGAHLLFGQASNAYRPFLERFAANCLAYLDGPAASAECFWPGIAFPATPQGGGGDIRRLAGSGDSARVLPGHVLVSGGRGDQQFDVAGRRILAIGRERAGITEVWSLPVRLARDVSARLDGVPEAEALREVRVLPSSVERLLETAGAKVLQTVSTSGGDLTIAYRLLAGAVRSFELSFDLDLRYHWPYPEGVLGGPRVEESPPQLTDRSDAIQAAPREPGLRRAPARPAGERQLRLLDSEGQLRGGVDVSPAWASLQVNRAVRLVFEEPGEVRLAFRGAQAGSATVVEDGPLLAIETPDPEFDEDFFWAVNGLRAFDVESPAGRGLVAGLAETGSGWWSGRLGYAWYFGRDSMWSALGCLGAGMHEAVGASLRLLADHQQIDGKMFHELTTAGVAHFDAADSTPLFLVGLERYFRWTGDLALLRELWPNAQKALEFAFSTDHDGDGLIENSGVGHGWVEGGRIYGAHATFYLNACWAAALQAMAVLAGNMDDGQLAARCRRQGERVRRILNERFYRPADGWFGFGIDRAGQLLEARTIEPAVAALFGLLEHDRTGRFFDQLGSPRYTTDWGVRFVANDDPAYHPRGYHHGSVWPLFTGWAALAEYAYRRPEAGFRHLRSSLALVRKGSLGHIDEVLDGDDGSPAGVCPHQLWSHAMTVAVAVDGMLGLRPDAVAGRLRLRPQLPEDWDFVWLRNLRLGPHRLTLTVTPSGIAAEDGAERITVDDLRDERT